MNQFLLVALLICSYHSALAQSLQRTILDSNQAIIIQKEHNINDTVSTKIKDLLDEYYKIKDGLVASSKKPTSKASKEFRSKLMLIDDAKMTRVQQKNFYPLKEKLEQGAQRIQNASSIESMRSYFNEFSESMWTLLKRFDSNNGITVYESYCPMKKMSWISHNSEILNPYYGKEMLTCGSVRDSIK